MEYLVMFLMFLSTLFDGLLLIFSCTNPSQIKGALVIHILVYLCMKILAKRFLVKYEGAPFFLALFLPCLGWFLISGLYLSLYYFVRDSMVLEDYEKYVVYERLLDNWSKIDVAKELRILSFQDQMNLLDAQSKKSVIMDLGTSQSEPKIRLLQRGLQDEDVEVKHYSAVTINMIENELSHLITDLREEFNRSKDPIVLQNLAKVYKSYIESDLISGKVYEVFNNEYIDILQKLRDYKTENIRALEELVKTYIRLGNMEMAKKYNAILLESAPYRVEGFLNQLECAYEGKELVVLKGIVAEYLKNQEEISPKLQDVLSFWQGDEEDV